MATLDRILVPLDGSPRAEVVLERIRPLLSKADSEVLLLVRAVCIYASIRGVTPTEVLACTFLEASTYLESVARQLRGSGIRFRPLVTEGPPAESILDAARRERATMIAMTSHGKTGLNRGQFGSVADVIVRAAPVPVLILRSFRPCPFGEPQETGNEPVAFRRILVPVDGSRLSEMALAPALEVGRPFSGEIVALHVIDRYGDPEAATRAAAAHPHQALGIRPLSVRGDPALLIPEIAREVGADLIAMTTHGRSGQRYWEWGSVTEKVLHATGLPLLIVHSPLPPEGVDVSKSGPVTVLT